MVLACRRTGRTLTRALPACLVGGILTALVLPVALSLSFPLNPDFLQVRAAAGQASVATIADAPVFVTRNRSWFVRVAYYHKVLAVGGHVMPLRTMPAFDEGLVRKHDDVIVFTIGVPFPCLSGAMSGDTMSAEPSRHQWTSALGVGSRSRSKWGAMIPTHVHGPLFAADSGAFAGLFGALVLCRRGWVNAIRRKRLRRRTCPECGYNPGGPLNTCPECRAAISARPAESA